MQTGSCVCCLHALQLVDNVGTLQMRIMCRNMCQQPPVWCSHSSSGGAKWCASVCVCGTVNAPCGSSQLCSWCAICRIERPVEKMPGAVLAMLPPQGRYLLPRNSCEFGPRADILDNLSRHLCRLLVAGLLRTDRRDSTGLSFHRCCSRHD